MANINYDSEERNNLQMIGSFEISLSLSVLIEKGF
jgi:hypothetical protein